MRSRVPFKAGDDPKAVTSTPGRETLTPLCTAGNLPPGPVAAAASKGTLPSKAGTARSFPSQTRTCELSCSGVPITVISVPLVVVQVQENRRLLWHKIQRELPDTCRIKADYGVI